MGLAILIAVAGIAAITVLLAAVLVLIASGLNEEDFNREWDA